MLERPLISIVDDDASVCEGMIDLLNAFGFAAVAFRQAGEFLASDRVRETSCLVADVQMPGMTGLELHDHLVRIGVDLPTILITAFPKATDRARALRTGVHCYLPKPFDERDLLACLRSALGSRDEDAADPTGPRR